MKNFQNELQKQQQSLCNLPDNLASISRMTLFTNHDSTEKLKQSHQKSTFRHILSPTEFIKKSDNFKDLKQYNNQRILERRCQNSVAGTRNLVPNINLLKSTLNLAAEKQHITKLNLGSS